MLFGFDYFVSQTLMVFIPDSASERVLKDMGPTCVTVVVVVALCTIPAHHRHAADDGGILHSARLLHTRTATTTTTVTCPMSFKTRSEAESGMKTIKVCETK